MNECNVIEVLLHYLQLFLCELDDPLNYILRRYLTIYYRFGLFELSACKEYKDLYISNTFYFILTLFNNYILPKELSDNNIKPYILSRIYSSSLSFGDIVGLVKDYFSIQDKNIARRKCSDIIKELKCVLVSKKLNQSLYYKISNEYKPELDIYSIHCFILSEFKPENIPFCAYIQKGFLDYFNRINRIYCNETFYKMVKTYISTYSKNSLLLNTQFLNMIIKSYLLYPNNLINFLLSNMNIADILNQAYLNDNKNQALKYIVDNILNVNTIKSELLVSPSPNKRKVAIDDMIKKKMRKLKDKQAKFDIKIDKVKTDLNEIDKNKNNENKQTCLICKECESKKDSFVYYAFHQITSLYNSKIKILSFCGHCCHMSCYDKTKRRQNLRFRSPFYIFDKIESDLWYIYIILVYIVKCFII